MSIASNKYKNYIITASLFVLMLAVLVVLSWIFNITISKNLFHGYVPMKFNTALCLILISTSLFLQAIDNNKAWRKLYTIFF